MKLEFQVIRDGAVIFRNAALAEEVDLPTLTAIALQRFYQDHPGLSLADEDMVLKWVEVEMLTA